MNPTRIAQAHDEAGHEHGGGPAGAEVAPVAVDKDVTAGEHAGASHTEGGVQVGQHWQVDVGPGVVNVDTVMYGGAVMIALIVIFGLLGRTINTLPGERSGYVGTVLESIVEFCQTLIHDFIGLNVKPYLWFVGAIFLFILTANWLSLLPWKAWEIAVGGPLGTMVGAPHPLVYETPTADLNMTMALGLITLVLYWFFGIKQNGVAGFLGHHWFDKPAILFPLRMLEDITRPVSLALRLFANMTAGHVLGLILLSLTYFVIPAILLPLEFFVGAVQAFVFAVLSASYIGAAAADHSHSH